MMKAVVAPQPDGAEELALVERPVPRPGKGEVLVKVAAAGVNPISSSGAGFIRRLQAPRTFSGWKSRAT